MLVSKREAGVLGQTRVNHYTVPPLALKRLLCAQIPGESFPNLQALICTLRAEGPSPAAFCPPTRTVESGPQVEGEAAPRSGGAKPRPRPGAVRPVPRLQLHRQGAARIPMSWGKSPDHREVLCLWPVGLSLTRPASAAGGHRGLSQPVFLKDLTCVSLLTFHSCRVIAKIASCRILCSAQLLAMIIVPAKTLAALTLPVTVRIPSHGLICDEMIQVIDVLLSRTGTSLTLHPSSRDESKSGCAHRTWGSSCAGMTPRARGSYVLQRGCGGRQGAIVVLERCQASTIPQLQHSLIH